MNIQQIDTTVLNWWQAHQTPFLTQNFINLTALGSTTTIVIFLFIWSLWTEARRFWLGLVCIVTVLLMVEGLKYAVDRPRPHPQNIIIPIPSSPSFPSGHSAMSMTVYMIAAFSTGRKRFVVCALLLSGLIGCSRMYLGVHYLSEVCTGWAIGLAVALLYCYMIPPPPVLNFKRLYFKHRDFDFGYRGDYNRGA